MPKIAVEVKRSTVVRLIRAVHDAGYTDVQCNDASRPAEHPHTARLAEPNRPT